MVGFNEGSAGFSGSCHSARPMRTKIEASADEISPGTSARLPAFMEAPLATVLLVILILRMVYTLLVSGVGGHGEGFRMTQTEVGQHLDDDTNLTLEGQAVWIYNDVHAVPVGDYGL